MKIHVFGRIQEVACCEGVASQAFLVWDDELARVEGGAWILEKVRYGGCEGRESDEHGWECELHAGMQI